MPPIRPSTSIIPLAVAAILAVASSARAQLATDSPAAILVFPYVVVDPARGIDTFIQISNSKTASVTLLLVLENDTAHCMNGLNACRDAVDCAAGDECRPGWSETHLELTMLSSSPYRWRLGDASLYPAGLCADTAKPCSSDADCNGSACVLRPTAPAVPETPFVGALRAFVLRDSENHPAVNALTGTATVERFQADAPQRFAVTDYRAIGLTSTGTNDGDPHLLLGGAGAEYGDCPNVLDVSHYFDGAVEPSVRSSQVESTLVLLPCGVDYPQATAPSTTVSYKITNEFDQLISMSSSPVFTVSGQLAQRLSAIDPAFSVGIAGTLTGHTQLIGQEHGVIGLVVETHRGLSDATLATSGVSGFIGRGVREHPEEIVLPGGLGIPTPTPTPIPMPAVSIHASPGRPGDTVEIAIGLQPLGFQLTALNPLQIGFDPALVSLGMCVSQVAGKSISAGLPQPGVLSVALNGDSTPLPAGTILTCQATIRFAPPGLIPLHCLGAVFRDQASDGVSAACADTAVEVVSDTPTPTPTPTPCAGDCNGDGRVNGGDVLTLVNIGLGTVSLGNCANGDANGDGAISIDEIVVAINRPSGECSAAP